VDKVASFNLATSMSRSIIKNAEKIEASATTISKLSAIKVTRLRNHLLEKWNKGLVFG
jgi:hypothetical protein